MALALRPTSLSDDPDRQDWSIYEDGAEIGRLYEDLYIADAQLRWFWSIALMGPARHLCQTSGRAPTLEIAKADFRRALARFKAANDSPFE
jgi:hypothetical protein